MAYMIEIQTACDAEYCKSRASYEVRAYGNETHGRYCKKHAEQRVKDLTKAEENNPAGFR